MNLPVRMPELKAQRWECRGCTRCCRELVVHLTSRDVRRIDEQGWSNRLAEPAYVRLGRETVLNHRPSGGCVFLSDDGRCRIHAEFGADAKPLACQLYPFSLHPDTGGFQASLRFDCPTAAANDGAPLSTHRPGVQKLAQALVDAGAFGDPPAAPRITLTDGRVAGAAEIDALTERIDEWLRDLNRPLDERLIALAGLLDTLAQANLNRVRDDCFVELLDMLFAELRASAAGKRPLPRPAPTPRQLRLFRMSVFAHCEYLSFDQARRSALASLRYRWNQLRRARRMAAGVGTVPRLLPDGGEVEFAGLPAVACGAPDTRQSIDELLTRYLRARLLGGTAFGPGYYGRSAFDGLRAWLLAAPIVLWLSRYVALVDQRSHFGLPDVQRAVGIVDRTAGRAPELGARSGRLRVEYLAADDGIARLILHFSA